MLSQIWRVEILFVCLACGCAAGDVAAPPKPAHPFAERIEAEGLPNFARLSDGLYRGAQPTREGFAELKRRGVKTVINFRAAHSDNDEAEGLGLKLFAIPFDAWDEPKEEDVVAFLRLATDPASQPVFFHCAHGKDRTGAMAAVCRLVVDEWPRERAIEEMKAFGFRTIWRDLLSYVRTCDPAALRQRLAAGETDGGQTPPGRKVPPPPLSQPIQGTAT